MSQETILRMHALLGLVALSRSMVYNKLNPKSPYHDPLFPKPITLGKRAVGFSQVEVLKWVEQQKAVRV